MNRESHTSADRDNEHRWNLELPDGIHRGKLAGLSEEERRRIVEKYKSERYGGSRDVTYGKLGYWYPDNAGVRRVSTVPGGGLVDLLSKRSKDVSVKLLASMGVKRVSSLRKQQVLDRVAEELDKLPDVLERRLVRCSDAEYAGFRLLLGKTEEVFHFTADDTVHTCDLEPLEPFTWLFYCHDTYHAIMPMEVRKAARAIDLDGIGRARNRRRQIPRAIAVLKQFCGVVPIAEIAPCCKELFGFEPSMKEVIGVLEAGIPRTGRYAYDGFDCACWPYPAPSANGYVLDESLSDDCAMRTARKRLEWHATVPYRVRVPWTREKPAARDAEAYCELESKTRDAYIRGLLAVRRRDILAVRGPLDRALAKQDVLSWACGIPEAIAVRRWLDGHVPDGENDYEYADGMLRLLVGCREFAPHPCGLLDLACSKGLFSHTFDTHELRELLVALEGALPSWRLNGWTPRAYHEACLAEAAARAALSQNAPDTKAA